MPNNLVTLTAYYTHYTRYVPNNRPRVPPFKVPTLTLTLPLPLALTLTPTLPLSAALNLPLTLTL